jgi:hypothetical protein
MMHVKYVLLVLCTLSLCAKVVGHTDRHLNPPAVETTAR